MVLTRKLKWLQEIFSLNTNWLRLSRRGIGVLLIVKWMTRFSNLEAHYSDAGILSREVLRMHGKTDGNFWPFFSPYFWSGSSMWAAFLGGVAVIAALSVVLDWKPQLFLSISWFLEVSLHARNPLVLNISDDFLKIVLFWLMFLRIPSRKTDSKGKMVFSWWGVGYQIQIACIYFFSGWMKGNGWESGSAIYYTLSEKMFTTNFGSFLLQFPSFLKGMSFFVLWWERLGPLLFFVPGLRMFAIAIFILLHLGLTSAIRLEVVSWLFITVLLGLLPSMKSKNASLVIQNKTDIKDPYAFAVPVTLIMMILHFNMAFLLSLPFPKELRQIESILSLKQDWSVYANVTPRDGWLVYPATQVNGHRIDILRNGNGLDIEHRLKIPMTLDDISWRNFYEGLFRSMHNRESPRHRYFADYLCREWNRHHEGMEKIRDIEILYLFTEPLPEQQRKAPKPLSIYKKECMAS